MLTSTLILRAKIRHLLETQDTQSNQAKIQNICQIVSVFKAKKQYSSALKKIKTAQIVLFIALNAIKLTSTIMIIGV